MKYRLITNIVLVIILCVSGWNAWRLISKEQHQGALLGGDFILTDTNNKPFDSHSLRDRYLLVYFGYSFCPDICPTELQRMTRVMNDLSPSIRTQITPLFITTDPVRDTPAALKEYITYFHPQFIALTGTLKQIKDITKKYGVYFNSLQKSSSDTEYLVDHSGYIYFMDKQGNYISHFTRDTSDDKIIEKITSIVK